MKKLQKLMLVAVLGLGGASFANETSSQNSYNNKASSTQTLQSAQGDNEATHRYAVGLGYGFQSIIYQETLSYYPTTEYESNNNFNSIYVLGNYQILYPNKKYSHITNGIEFMAGIGYSRAYQSYYINSSLLGETDSTSAFNFDLGMLGVAYRPISNDISFGFKVGLGYSMQYIPNNGDSFLYNSYGTLWVAEIDAKQFAIGILYGYYFGVHESSKDLSYSTWSLLGTVAQLSSHKFQVYALYRF